MKCRSCNTPLKPVFEGSTDQFVDALDISFNGGYGEFVDVTTRTEEDALKTTICGGCASELIENNSWIRELFTEAFGFDIVGSRTV